MKIPPGSGQKERQKKCVFDFVKDDDMRTSTLAAKDTKDLAKWTRKIREEPLTSMLKLRTE